MKTYKIFLQKNFPKNHKKSGERTFFKEKFLKGQGIYHKSIVDIKDMNFRKIHVILPNYDLWEKRISEVISGNASLSVREWEGTPGKSKQIEIKNLSLKNGIGIQRLHFENFSDLLSPEIEDVGKVYILDIAKNDGLTFRDWYHWIKSYDLKKDFAVIHFTNFRYY